MFKIITKYYYAKIFELKVWSSKKILGLFLFNISVMMMILLYTAGYFAPFFPLTINSIVFGSLILAILLLGIRSRIILLISLGFLIFAAFLRIMNVEVWAERTAIYCYQSLIVGFVLSIIEFKNNRA